MSQANYPAKNLILVTLTVVLTLILAACGGSSETEAPAEEVQYDSAVEGTSTEAGQTAGEVEPSGAVEAEIAAKEVDETAVEQPVAEASLTEGWSEFVSEAHGFSVLMPGEPEPLVQNLDTAAGATEVSMFMYEGQSADGRGYAYGAAYTAMPIDLSIVDETELKSFFDDSRDGGLRNLNASLVKEEDSPLQGYPGRFVEFAGEDLKGMNWFILAENNLYQVIVLTESSAEFTDEDFAFLKSFTLLDTLPQPAAAPAGETAAASPTVAPPTAQTTYAFGQPIEFDNLVVTVNNVLPYETDDIFTQPAEGNKFLLVDITVQNNNKDIAYLLPFTDLAITDANGNRYEYSLLVSALGEELQMYEGEIPGETTHTGVVPFEVVADATGLALMIDTLSFQDGGEVFVPLDGETAAVQNASAPATGLADAGNPEVVLQAVFDAAKSGEFDLLAALCDPTGENDSDTQAICAIAGDTTTQASFVEYFSTGQITGAAVISADGSEAAVPFSFGPDNQQEETMNLINRDGQWYLSSF